MKKERQIYTLGLVLLGNFNPVIINPQWLVRKKLIRETEAETAKVEIIHPEITRFELDWMTFEATPTRIDFKTNKESHFVVLRDLVISIFSSLGETPLHAMGINHLCHYSLNSLVEYEQFGYWLSPVEQFGDVLNKPKLQSIEILETKEENSKELFRLIITPSDLVHDRKSVVFNTNHHVNFDENSNGGDKLIQTLNIKWDDSFIKVEKLNQAVWEKFKL